MIFKTEIKKNERAKVKEKVHCHAKTLHKHKICLHRSHLNIRIDTHSHSHTHIHPISPTHPQSPTPASTTHTHLSTARSNGAAERAHFIEIDDGGDDLHVVHAASADFQARTHNGSRTKSGVKDRCARKQI
jgi:hypothetical protein